MTLHRTVGKKARNPQSPFDSLRSAKQPLKQRILDRSPGVAKHLEERMQNYETTMSRLRIIFSREQYAEFDRLVNSNADLRALLGQAHTHFAVELFKNVHASRVAALLARVAPAKIIELVKYIPPATLGGFVERAPPRAVVELLVSIDSRTIAKVLGEEKNIIAALSVLKSIKRNREKKRHKGKD